MFSVIIPLYNKSAFIEKCLKSVLDQTFQDFELIVVNDGSTDNSAEKVKNLIGQTAAPFAMRPEHRFILLNQPNSGISVARNNGVKASKYDYITFLDADDWWDVHFLEEMKRLIDDYPMAGMFGSKYYWVKNGSNRGFVNHEPDDFRGYIDYIKAYNYSWWMPISSSSVVIRKNIFLEAGGFKGILKFGEDFDLWIRIALNHKVAYINRHLSYYNQDVPVLNRVLGYPKLYHPVNHFIFNLDYLNENEKTNHELKTLLDGLRVRSLQQYHLSGMYPNEVRYLLDKVDFKKQPYYYRFFYKTPIPLIKLFQNFRITGSKIKQHLTKKIV